MLGMKNHFDISGSIEIREVDIAGVACICRENCYLASHLNTYRSSQTHVYIIIPLLLENWKPITLFLSGKKLFKKVKFYLSMFTNKKNPYMV